MGASVNLLNGAHAARVRTLLAALEARGIGVGESYGDLADRMAGASDRYPHVWDEVNEECAECGATDQVDACTSHPDWETEPGLAAVAEYAAGLTFVDVRDGALSPDAYLRWKAER